MSNITLLREKCNTTYIEYIVVQSNYEPLNRNNDCIGQWSWYYRGCWHQTCPPLEIQIAEQCISKYTPSKGSELLKLTAFQLSTQSVGNLPSSPKRAAMPDTCHFKYSTVTACHCLSVLKYQNYSVKSRVSISQHLLHRWQGY